MTTQSDTARILCPSVAQLEHVAAQLLAQHPGRRVFAFYGALGAGKTSLIKAMCRQIGVREHVSSPSFSIVNNYHAGARPVYHFDLYRTRKLEELYDLGYEEYLFGDAWCFIEWPDIISNLLPPGTVKLLLKKQAGDLLEITYPENQ